MLHFRNSDFKLYIAVPLQFLKIFEENAAFQEARDKLKKQHATFQILREDANAAGQAGKGIPSTQSGPGKAHPIILEMQTRW